MEEKQVTYRCPKCAREYAEKVYKIGINISTGQVYRIPHRPRRCEACGSGLVRHVTVKSDKS